MDEFEKPVTAHIEESLKKNNDGTHVDLQAAGCNQLQPRPSADPNDPLNWTGFEKHTTLMIAVLMVFSGPFDGASPASGFNVQANDFGVPVADMLESIGTQSIMLGIGLFIWVPLSNRYGRKPIYLISAITAMMGSLGCALANSLGGFIAGRMVNGFGCSGPMSLVSLTVKDLFFVHERGQKMGLWTLFFGISPYIGSLLDGVMTTYTSWRWMQWLTFFFWVFLTGGCLLMPETLYYRQAAPENIPLREPFWERVKLRRFEGDLTWHSFYRPITMVWYPSILFPSVYYANVYGFSVYGFLGVLPFAFGELYGFNSVGQGLVTLAFLVGTIIGEPMAGPFSDWIVQRQAKRSGGVRCPEQRLRAIWLGVVLLPISLILFGCTIHYHTHWIGPCIGMGLSAFAIQIISTVSVTYAIDCYDHAAGDVSLLYNFLRQLFSFYVPFYIHGYVTSVGYAWAFGIYAIISMCLSLPLVILNLYGTIIRNKLGHIYDAGQAEVEIT
ncbi:uncharacterized protein N7503_003417 [Penicillium pulvis]|uniref:uncharacterized protein n=1 Tax=Penicillium pulvis TaxID=1562058 RepID=UPI0025492CAC|nr:uncharacterized protein N7503_003417 [Penicillium pulvis]KAJ5805815.1 hypothetical protein N7503_003417 [Penicillium pulvis]